MIVLDRFFGGLVSSSRTWLIPPQSFFNPLVPDAHYSERQDKPVSLQIQQLEVDLKWNCGFLFFAPWGLMG